MTALPSGEFLEHAAQHRLHRAQDVVLRHEAHLHVELVELAIEAVGARVFVAEAGRDLEIAVEPGHHQQLLVHLRGLRQRVELARMQARGHEEVARAFGRRSSQDRRLELVEADIAHAAAHRGDHPLARHDVGVHRLAAQVEEAVFEANVLRIFRLAEDRQRQFLGLRQHLDLGGEDFDLAGGEVRVDRGRVAVLDLTVDPDHPFAAHLFGSGEGGRIRIGDDLRDAVMVAQVDEKQPAMVAHAVNPARKTDH